MELEERGENKEKLLPKAQRGVAIKKLLKYERAHSFLSQNEPTSKIFEGIESKYHQS